MTEQPDNYAHNPYVSEDRRRSGASSAWVRSFSCETMTPLIVCRGPIRKEALDTFAQMGMAKVGILLSEKDSIVYPNALAPELRVIAPERVHRVPDYTGASKEERAERIAQIVEIARNFGYNAVFAGYGFMAEDEDFVAAIEDAGLMFIGPCSRTVRAAGRKDEAKRTALRERVSVTPGVDNATARALVAKHKTRAALLDLAAREELSVAPALQQDPKVSLEDLADGLLNASYQKGVDLISVEELCVQLQQDIEKIFMDYPGRRVRLKAIGGGGGKGQRILSGAAKTGQGSLAERTKRAAAAAPAAAREILAEVKATGAGDNKNMLIELNVEQTRHHEIQLVGNGTWCVTLGGRDCSLQMHEQKLLEISITQEALLEDIDRAKNRGADAEVEALHGDLSNLRAMEREAQAFGRAVGLDSASTFECIVDDDRHFFMEVNTRIQVEHRVSELCYALRFDNPDDPSDAFVVNSLVEMMALLAMHKERLPQPTRVRRQAAAAEVRLNATDRALGPHAGGMIRSWSDPLAYEVRDDQGICIKNPDTGLFMRYKLAGAYDSNVALLVTVGDSRAQSFDRLYEILRCTMLRGNDLCTNLEFHFGLVSWFRARGVNAKPTTRFVVPYLTQVGLLKEALGQVDFSYAYAQLQQRAESALRSVQGEQNGEQNGAAVENKQSVFSRKQTLLLRPIARLVEEPHFYSAWLSAVLPYYQREGGSVRWLRNPLQLVADLYELLHMEPRPEAPAAHVIWEHDQALLDEGFGFYAELERRLSGRAGDISYSDLAPLLTRLEPAAGFDPALWAKVRAAHAGYQAGLGLLDLLIAVGEGTGYYDLCVNRDLSIHIPERLFDPDLQARMRKMLVPPPATRADEIVAERGGMFYGQEAPHLPPLIREGDHFEVGQPLYVLEVMKMFTKVCAPFSGTVDKFLLNGRDGVIIHKGQPIFKITPDVKFSEEDEVQRQGAIRAKTGAYLDALTSSS